jgi:hypothetical protein
MTSEPQKKFWPIPWQELLLAGFGYIVVVATGMLIVSLVGCGRGGMNTPEATFERFKSAFETKDYKTAFAQITPQTQDGMIGSMALHIGAMTAFDPKNAPEAQRILDKYEVQKLPDNSVPDREMIADEALKQVVARVKDKPGCIAEFRVFMDKNRPSKERVSIIEDLSNATLADLKIEGDSATATVITKRNGQDITDSIKFKKMSGVWLIDGSADVARDIANGIQAVW